MLRRSLIVLLVLVLSGPAFAQDEAKSPANAVLDLLPAPAVSRHTLQLPDRQLAYSAAAGTLPLLDEKGKRTAEIFSVAFTAEPRDPSRPVTFLFNGGPGAASAFLMLGGVGPRMVAFSEDGDFLPP